MITEADIQAFTMAMIPVETDSPTMAMIRKQFMHRDRQWSEADARAEYRLREYEAIMDVVANGTKLKGMVR